MPELTIICTFTNNPGNAGKPIVQIGVSQDPKEETKRFILGPGLMSQTEIDNQIDNLISQLESARKEAKIFLNESKNA